MAVDNRIMGLNVIIMIYLKLTTTFLTNQVGGISNDKTSKLNISWKFSQTLKL